MWDDELDHILPAGPVRSHQVACRLQRHQNLQRLSMHDFTGRGQPGGVVRSVDQIDAAQASSAWMRRENAGCVTCLSCADREKLRVSKRLTKSLSHLVSTPISPLAANDPLFKGLQPPSPPERR